MDDVENVADVGDNENVYDVCNVNDVRELGEVGQLAGQNLQLMILGDLVDAQRQKAEHEPFTSHFERRSGSSKRVRNARAKTRSEDHATPL